MAEPTLEQILLHLMVPDNDVIAAATAALQQRSSAPGSLACIPELVNILTSSPEAGARHMAAILIRQRIVKHWMKLPGEMQAGIKATLLATIISEPESIIKRGVAGIISVIAKFQLGSGDWPDLLQFLYETCMNPEPLKRG